MLILAFVLVIWLILAEMGTLAEVKDVAVSGFDEPRT